MGMITKYIKTINCTHNYLTWIQHQEGVHLKCHLCGCIFDVCATVLPDNLDPFPKPKDMMLHDVPIIGIELTREQLASITSGKYLMSITSYDLYKESELVYQDLLGGYTIEEMSNAN